MDQVSVSPTYRMVKHAALTTFLKCGSTTSYYKSLGIDQEKIATVTSREIHTAYVEREKALNEATIQEKENRPRTKEETAEYTKIWEAGHVLLDFHRRENYDMLGQEGLKIYEDPAYLAQGGGKPSILLKNFQDNKDARFILLVYSFCAFLYILSCTVRV